MTVVARMMVVTVQLATLGRCLERMARLAWACFLASPNLPVLYSFT